MKPHVFDLVTNDSCRAPRARFLFFSAFIFFLSVNGCALVGRGGPQGEPPCALLDSMYQHSGFEIPLLVNGKATFDAEQHRVRGKILLDIRPGSDLILEFSSSQLFGSQREDFLFSFLADTLRVLDRERGSYYEGDEADQFLAETLRMGFSLREEMKTVLGVHPGCDRLDDLRVKQRSGGDTVFDGELSGSRFRVVFSGDRGRLKEIVWPVRTLRGSVDQMTVTYDWEPDSHGGHRLEGLTLWLEDREWRCRITDTTS